MHLKLLATLIIGLLCSGAVRGDPSSVSAFGLALGSDASENNFVLSRPLTLSEPVGKQCEKRVLSQAHFGHYDTPAPDLHEFIFGYSNRDSHDRFVRNVHKVDFSSRISGGSYTVRGFEQDILVCFAYFDNKLMNVITFPRPSSEREKLLDAISIKYPDPFRDAPKGTVILADHRGVMMSHERLRRQFLYWAIDLHKKAEERSKASSPF